MKVTQTTIISNTCARELIDRFYVTIGRFYKIIKVSIDKCSSLLMDKIIISVAIQLDISDR